MLHELITLVHLGFSEPHFLSVVGIIQNLTRRQWDLLALCQKCFSDPWPVRSPTILKPRMPLVPAQLMVTQRRHKAAARSSAIHCNWEMSFYILMFFQDIHHNTPLRPFQPKLKTRVFSVLLNGKVCISVWQRQGGESQNYFVFYAVYI